MTRVGVADKDPAFGGVPRGRDDCVSRCHFLLRSDRQVVGEVIRHDSKVEGRKRSACGRGRLVGQVSAVHRTEFGAGESSAPDFGVTMTAHAIGRAGIGVRVLDDEIVVADPPASLCVAIDLPVAHHEDGQNAEAPGEAGPEAVPSAGLVEQAGPDQRMVEEGIDTVHRPSRSRHGTQVNLSRARDPDTRRAEFVSGPLRRLGSLRHPSHAELTSWLHPYPVRSAHLRPLLRPPRHPRWPFRLGWRRVAARHRRCGH